MLPLAAPALLCSLVALAAPADRLPAPAPERCLAFIPDPSDEHAAPEGLSYDQVVGALSGVIQTALYCERPAGMREVHAAFELVVGCDGVVASIQVADAGGAPEAWLSCVSGVIEKADFPAHDMADGMPVTYPVSASW